MKNEDRIVELLAESLRKQDQLTAIVEKHTAVLDQQLNVLGQISADLRVNRDHVARVDKTLEMHSDIFADHIRLISRVEDQLQKLNDKMDRLLDFEDRIKQLETAVFKKGA